MSIAETLAERIASVRYEACRPMRCIGHAWRSSTRSAARWPAPANPARASWPG